MKRILCILIAILLGWLASRQVHAQSAPEAESGPPPRGERAGPPPGGPGRFGPPALSVLLVFDADRDGELSSEEIAASAERLRKLDADGDGKLTSEELRPSFGPGGPRGGPGAGRNALSPDKVVERLLTLDINGDGQLTKDEVPDRMLGLFTRADENHDGTMTREELLDMARREAMNR